MDTLLSPKGIDTQRKIWLAATKVVARKGIESASVTEIAKAAKITRSLIQYYLPKKSDLMIELIQFIAKEGYDYFVEQGPKLRLRSELPESLERRIRLNFDFFTTYPHYFQCFMLFFYQATYDKKCRELNTRLVSNAVAAMNEDMDDLALAERIYFSMHSSVQRCFIVDSNRPLEKALSEFIKETEQLLQS